MLVFIDESGDSGLKTDQGSSRYFTIALVVFEDHDEANSCDQRIDLLRTELRLVDKYEFHFRENSHRVRLSFLSAIQPYNFFYYGIIINKDTSKLWGAGFQYKESFYKYACGLVFENAKPYLNNAIVLIDKSGHSTFRQRLAKYLKDKVNKVGKTTIKKVKMQKSDSNNLLQLVDYVAGIINRKCQGKKNADEYSRYVKPKEIYVQKWPK